MIRVLASLCTDRLIYVGIRTDLWIYCRVMLGTDIVEMIEESDERVDGCTVFKILGG